MRNFLEAGKTPLSGRVDAADEGLMTQDVQPLITLLELLFGPMTARVAKEMKEATLRSVLEIFWFTQKLPLLSKLCLVVNPSAKPGEGCYGFVDIFIPDSPLSPCVELKNVTLEGLLREENKGQLLSDASLAQLRSRLQR